MSIARAFTTRRKLDSPPDSSAPPARSQSTRKGPIQRSQISMPVALISTTNMLSYNAPDIEGSRQRSATLTTSTTSTSSSRTSQDSDSRSSASSTQDTDASSLGSSPVSPNPPKGNHLSGYFSAANNKTAMLPTPTIPSEISSGVQHSSPQRSASTASLAQKKLSVADDPKPAVPTRALSHSRASHEFLARQRSLRNSASSPRPTRDSREQRASVDIFNAADDPMHPFGKELEELKEVAEELGGAVNEAVNNEDLTFMLNNKLAKFDAADYLCEIQPLFAGLFHKQIVALQTGWI
ncbi:hypothetical protein EJ05DRAFT_504216 [Pseudovirgaria hyperparasitica]|uniref:BRCT domain-containing protein n=1 Tax=Pseudovirgaria hyperparasitica TaxID=470096 RepID=A0A6A6VV47_9PEZI|nr:uncharacterized protein EJ05DRAFT_504216 [Pseudovirgaria hyperparasitica]KAF2754103.1 hypothetical protein EJ05DRAFT_504216 [Pseudovirgaria hyperparasitica]